MPRKSLKTDGSYAAEVGRRLRNYRLSQGWTLVDAQAKTGMATATIASYERADRNASIDQLGHIAAGYGCTVATFLPDDAAEPTVLPAEQIAADLKVMALELAHIRSQVDGIRAQLHLVEEAVR